MERVPPFEGEQVRDVEQNSSTQSIDYVVFEQAVIFP